jgi:hypothetical protein
VFGICRIQMLLPEFGALRVRLRITNIGLNFHFDMVWDFGRRIKWGLNVHRGASWRWTHVISHDGGGWIEIDGFQVKIPILSVHCFAKSAPAAVRADFYFSVVSFRAYRHRTEVSGAHAVPAEFVFLRRFSFSSNSRLISTIRAISFVESFSFAACSQSSLKRSLMLCSMAAH